MAKVVVIGGDAAGMSAASQVVRGDRSAEVIVFERGDFTSYAACGLPYFVGGQVADASMLVARTPQQHRSNGIDVRMACEATSIDTDARSVQVRSLETGLVETHGFDHLVIATGASPIRPPFRNIDADGVSVVHTIPDALAIDSWIRGRTVKRAVVIGAGYIGIEIVEALLNRGLEVTVIEKLDAPMATLDPDMGALVADAMVDMGAEVRLGTTVEGLGVDSAGHVRSVETDSGEIDAELVVMGLGVRPRVGIAAEAGVVIGPTGAIATDPRMGTSVDGIWAAGDCAESLHRVSRRPVWIALGTHANKHGRVAGMNIAGHHAEFPGVIGTAVTKVGDTEIGLTGLNEAGAAAAGFTTVSHVAESSTRAHYYPDGSPISVKVVAEEDTGRILGAQIVGGPGSAKRIDAMAVAVWNEMTVDEYSQLDLGYCPPLSPVWDPTLIAARLVAQRL